jgi:hypothetical protein
LSFKADISSIALSTFASNGIITFSAISLS